MKKYFVIGFIGIIILSLGVVGYGAYINYRDENAISKHMANRKLVLKGEKSVMYSMRPTIELNILTLDSKQMTDAVTRVDGVIVETLVQQNSRVNKGDMLFKVENEEIPLKIMQVESNILKARADQQRLSNVYRRYKELRGLDAVSQEKLEESEASYIAANATIEELAAQKEQLLLMQKRQVITSPIDGEVLLVYRNLGAYVQQGTALALVGNFDKLYFEAELEDKIISRMAVGKDFQVVFNVDALDKIFRTDYKSGNKGADQVFKARIADISPAMSEPADIRKVVWEFNNDVGLLEPKAYEAVKLESQETKNVLAAPLAAMVDERRSIVFVVNDDGVLERREIATGVNDGKYIEILSGITEGEIVVISGAEGLEDGMMVTVELERGDDDGHQ